MLTKIKPKPQKRKVLLNFLGGLAQVSLVASIFLSQLDLAGMDFLEGVLLGFSMVGNLVYIYHLSRNRSVQ